MTMNNLLFYSTNTYLAWYINEEFYNGRHFVWCSPVFNSQMLSKYDLHFNIPSSSNPYSIYRNLKSDIEQNDSHSYKIKEIKNGIRFGAANMLKKGLITNHEFGIIDELIETSTLNDFRPLLYIIPSDKVDSQIEIVKIKERANKFGCEFRIIDLNKCDFEIIEF